MPNIILIGFSSTGKSTVGRRLASRLGFSFVDIDDLIKSLFRAKTRNSLSCRDIVRLFGHEEFNALETEALSSLLATDKTVIATGGGAPMTEGNRLIINQLGTVIYLCASPEAILKRMHRKGAPAFMKGSDGEPNIAGFMTARDPIYREISDLILETTSLDPDSSSAKIAYLLQNPE